MIFKAVISILLLLSVHYSYGQNTKFQYSNVCSRLIVQVGQQWRLDSVGKQNIRKKFVQKFIKAKIDRVSSSQIWKNLGSPSEIWKERDKTSYVYYYFYGKRYGFKFYAAYLVFTFDIDNSLLISISQEEDDRG